MKFGMLILTVLGLTAPAPAAQIATVGVQVWPNARVSNEQPSRAIDGDTSTYTWSTESFTTAESSVGVDFGAEYSLGHISLWKAEDGGGGPNIKNLVIEYTTDAVGVALSARTWTAVSGMVNGFNGAEFMTATSVNSDGTVTGDVHNSLTSGWASLSFDAVNATGVRIRFSTPSGGFNHYRLAEFTAFEGDPIGVPEPATFWMIGASACSLVWMKLRARRLRGRYSARNITNASTYPSVG